MTWLILDGMLGLEDCAGHELLGMLVGQPVEHPVQPWVPQPASGPNPVGLYMCVGAVVGVEFDNMKLQITNA
jgi:hypothetical protein